MCVVMRLVAITLLCLMCMLKNGFALENLFCVKWLSGVVLHVNGRYGIMRLGDDGNGILASVEGEGLEVGMRLPQSSDLCLTYLGRQVRAIRKDKSHCRLRHYQISSWYITGQQLQAFRTA